MSFLLLLGSNRHPIDSGETPCRSRLCPRSSWPTQIDGTLVGALRMRLLRGIPPEERKPIVTFAQLHPIPAERMRDRTTRGSSIRFELELPRALSIIVETKNLYYSGRYMYTVRRITWHLFLAGLDSYYIK